MEIILPEFGVIFWTVLTFLVVWYILRKFAWKPILNMLETRDKSIESALNSAEDARKEMAIIKSENDKMAKKARVEREQMLKEARESQNKILAEDRENAKEEAAKLIEKARRDIKDERENAFLDMKKQLVEYSVDIAEKILRNELQDPGNQKKMAEQYIKDIKFN